MALTQSQIEKKLSNEHLDELLELWQTEQGAAKRRDLELMAAARPTASYDRNQESRSHVSRSAPSFPGCNGPAAVISIRRIHRQTSSPGKQAQRTKTLPWNEDMLDTI